MRDNVTKLIEGPHLLYASGDGVNFDRFQKIVETVPNFQLGPLCWLVQPPKDRTSFAELLKAALPEVPHKSEFLLCPISKNGISDSRQGGWGLHDWLQEHGGEA